MTDLDSDFYLAFENRFRGDDSDVIRKFAVYAPLLEAIEGEIPNPSIVDLGCGRGEWLNHLQQRGWRVFGVDQNEAMIYACEARGLSVREVDLLTHLASMADSSVDLLCAFHVIEHMPFKDLLKLCREAQRVVTASGLILFETPNPENLRVGTDLFYLDPTHIRPLSPELMEFVMQWAGAAWSQAIRIHSAREFDLGDALGRQIETYFSYSPDYAILATANGQVIKAAHQMAGDPGPSTPRFYQALDHVHESLQATDQTLANQANAMHGEIERLRGLVEAQSLDIVRLKHRSLGWRLANLKHRLTGGLWTSVAWMRGYPKKTLERFLAHMAGLVRRHPRLKQVVVRVLRASPPLLDWVTRRMTPTATLSQLTSTGSQDAYPVVTDLEMKLVDAVTPDEHARS